MGSHKLMAWGGRDAGGSVDTSRPSTPRIPGFEQLELVAVGGFARVYRAYQREFQRTVAIKILDIPLLDDRTRRRFERECAATGRLTGHPNIVTPLASGFTDDGLPYIVMYYLANGTLADALSARGAFQTLDVLRIGVKLCGALETAHDAGILHRDVKPENVLLSTYDEPVLADFGISAIADPASQTKRLDAYTPVHAPPEVLETNVATKASDIYSLASTLYMLAAGRAPFAGPPDEGIAPLLVRILGSPVPPIDDPGVPEAFVAVLTKAMAKSPADRFASAAELAAALQTVQRSLGVMPTELVVPRPGAVDAAPQQPRQAHSAGPPSPRFVPVSPPTAPPAAPPAPAALAKNGSAALRPGRLLRVAVVGLALSAVAVLLVGGVTYLLMPAPATTGPPATAAVNAAPSDVKATMSGAAAHVTWKDNADRRYPFLVVWHDAGGRKQQLPVVNTVTEATVGGLDPGVRYCFGVGTITDTNAHVAFAAAPACVN